MPVCKCLIVFFNEGQFENQNHQYSFENVVLNALIQIHNLFFHGLLLVFYRFLGGRYAGYVAFELAPKCGEP